MKLSDERFNKCDCLIADKDGKHLCATLYCYESVKALYDVLVITKAVNDKETIYKTNLKLSEKNKYHEAIENYYNLNEKRISNESYD